MGDTNRAFSLFELRSRDLDAARAFYSNVLGSDFWEADVALSPLPERAAALGAPPHWLGHVYAASVDGVLSQMVEAGGQPLGPPSRDAAGHLHQGLRDPLGTVLAITDAAPKLQRSAVGWKVLLAPDEAKAADLYSRTLGWVTHPAEWPGSSAIRVRTFATSPGGQPGGAITNSASLPGVHCHWLFCFCAENAERALASVRENGGTHLAPGATPGGGLIVACEDSEGAAFGLFQRARDE